MGKKDKEVDYSDDSSEQVQKKIKKDKKDKKKKDKKDKKKDKKSKKHEAIGSLKDGKLGEHTIVDDMIGKFFNQQF